MKSCIFLNFFVVYSTHNIQIRLCHFIHTISCFNSFTFPQFLWSHRTLVCFQKEFQSDTKEREDIWKPGDKRNAIEEERRPYCELVRVWEHENV